jgi:hypothetical protein
LLGKIKICLNKTYSKASIAKHLCDAFSIQISLEEADVLSPFLFNFALE